MSLLGIGQRPPTKETPASLVLDCHQRIRSFTQLSVRLAEADAPESELAEAAARVHRYFTVALPLHVADEEESIAPRLLLVASQVADAIERMEREHLEHVDLLARLISAWAALKRGARPPSELSANARQLQAALDAHLEAEERIIVPALAALPETDARAILQEMRRRRGA